MNTCLQPSRNLYKCYHSKSYAKRIEFPSGGAPPDLRKLSLVVGIICWSNNTFPKITHLSLHKQLATPTLDEFVDALEALPCSGILECVTIPLFVTILSFIWTKK